MGNMNTLSKTRNTKTVTLISTYNKTNVFAQVLLSLRKPTTKCQQYEVEEKQQGLIFL